MKDWLIVLSFLIGLALGVSGTVLAPRLAGPYLPGAIWGRAEPVEGTVVAKQREPDRLLLTVLTAQGAILATFKEKVAELDLLIEEGDTLTLALRRYEPFVEDPVIERVGKEQPPHKPGDGKPLPPPTGEEGFKEKAP